MKKLVAMILVLMFVCVCASAETVYVSIRSGQGELALAHAAVEVSDADGDGIVSLNDALYAAHEAHYEGGAAAGFASSMSDYGISLDCLWGEANGGSYGYYLNNLSPNSLLDPVQEGDHLYAYAFTDLESWSDTFCFFDFAAIETSADFELTLTAHGYDADWNVVYTPVEGAEITVDGEDSGIVTDANGKAILDLSAGEYVISARSEQINMVAPVCIARIG